MRRALGGLIAGAAVVLWALWPREQALPPAAPLVAGQGVVSAGLCADQLAVPLIERDRLRGLSPQAADPAVSAVAERAKGIPVIAPSAEALILSGAKTVLLNTYGDTNTEHMLTRLGIKVVRVPYDPDLPSIPTSLRRLGQQLGAPQRGEEMAQDFERRVQTLASEKPQVTVVAAYYRPDGGSAGQGTYVSEAMDAAGYQSLASTLGNRGWGRLDLEQLVLHPPQVMITSFFSRNGYSANRAFSKHPVFKQLYGTLPTVAIPGRMWGCGNHTVILAAEEMARQRKKSFPSSRDLSP